MLMNEQLWTQAEQLAKRHYRVTTEIDTLSDGQQVFLLRRAELRGCKAQGGTREEAEQIFLRHVWITSIPYWKMDYLCPPLSCRQVI